MAVSADTPEQAADLAKKLGLAFPLVSDTDLRLAAAYGVRQEGKDSALPATFVLDGERRVLWRVVGDRIVDRPSVDETLAHVP